MPHTTGLVSHPDYDKHTMPPGHPERVERLPAILKHLRASGLWDKLTHITPTPADPASIAEIHTQDYIKRVEQTCRRGGGLLDWGDTPVCPASYDVALLAAGGLLAAVDAVVAKKVDNAFCLVRPPGHHARPGGGMGFCVFNNIAIAARHVQKRHSLKRILIADWDVHHGNGTQEAFNEDPTVSIVGIHRFPFYPGTGSADETGKGAGAGSALNLPMPAGTDGKTYVGAFQRALKEVAERFQPEFLLVSAGFDPHEEDPLGGMGLADGDFAALGRAVRETADEHCGGRLVATLEGGYNLQAQARSVAAVLREFMA
jgi:acetoin utilization deacetylase AcuC-like enzyme